jgi:hypothetical protein
MGETVRSKRGERIRTDFGEQRRYFDTAFKNSGVVMWPGEGLSCEQVIINELCKKDVGVLVHDRGMERCSASSVVVSELP